MERSLRINIVAGFLGMFWLAVPLGAPLPLLMQAVDASATQLGILSASWQIAMLAQIPAAFLVERMARRKPLWAVTSIAHRMLWAVPAAVPLLYPDQRSQWPVLIIAALSVSNLLTNLGTASWQSWMADLVPEKSAGSFWGTRQRFLALALMLATGCFGWVLDRFSADGSLLGFQCVFGLCAFFGVSDIVVHLWVREPPPVRANSVLTIQQRIRAPFTSRGFQILTGSMMLWTTAQSLLGYTIGMPGFFSMVHLKETFGASFSQASLIFLFNALGAVLSTPWLGRWMDNAGAAAVMARLLAFAPISQMGWWFAPYGSFEIAGSSWPRAVVWMLPVSLVQGAVLTGALLCQLRLTQMTTNTGGRTVAMALHWSLTGIAGAVGALGAGWLQDHWRSPQSANASAWNFDTAFNFLVFASTLLTWFGAFPLMRALERRFSKPQIE